jgi:GT2 family glycosyltransferase
MISLVICSRTSQLNESLRQNIDETIGVEYELVLIDNSKNELSIFEAYNKGINISKYTFICFMHDDIEYLTNNWGKLAIRHFEDKKVGAIGISGSPYLSILPGPWWASGIISKYLMEVNKQKESIVNIAYHTPEDNALEVVALDGVWLFIRKAALKDIQFDENTFKGYHFYDLDISMQLKKAGFILLSVYDVLIKHQSMGDVNYSWLKTSLLFSFKWRNRLPMSIIKTSLYQKILFEYKSLRFWIATIYKLTKKIF